MQVVVEFSMSGNARFLSHAETARVFQRACVRAAVELEYSSGFNPRPRLSLPLPRSVGVETEGDLLCLGLSGPAEAVGDSEQPFFDARQFKLDLAEQLPDGIEVLSVGVEQKNASFQPRLATYIFRLSAPRGQGQDMRRRLQSRIQQLLASDRLELQRYKGPKTGARKVDVRAFLDSIVLDGLEIAVRCRVGPGGSVRVDELLKLLELGIDELDGPCRRTEVKWQEQVKC
jgi:radical SAM-linked protein